MNMSINLTINIMKMLRLSVIRPIQSRGMTIWAVRYKRIWLEICWLSAAILLKKPKWRFGKKCFSSGVSVSVKRYIFEFKGESDLPVTNIYEFYNAERDYSGALFVYPGIILFFTLHFCQSCSGTWRPYFWPQCRC